MINSTRIGKQTLVFSSRPAILSYASVVGPKEGRGPLSEGFDMIMEDAANHESSYEMAEYKMILDAAERCMDKAGIDKEDVDIFLGGDLLNQIISTSLTARALSIPLLGLYGACSTMAESLLLGSALVNAGYARKTLCTAGSHYCTAERQFRYPLEYGNQRTPAAQWTVTGAGAYILGTGAKGNAAIITHGTIGKVVDFQITDANNMGAAMAPAAADTLATHFCDTKRMPKDYDRIFTGDLGKVGSELLRQLMQERAYHLDKETYQDCGLLIFDPSDDVHAGASGCGCSASVLAAHILPHVISGEWKRVLLMATGALMSTTSSQQGESIPGIAHAVVIEHAGEDGKEL